MWSEFVAGLDAIRVEIRSTKNMKHAVPAQDLLFDKVFQLIDRAGSTTVAPVPTDVVEAEPVQEMDQENPYLQIPVEVVERGNGEGRMVIMSRDTPRISRPASLEEVFDEKELGK